MTDFDLCGALRRIRRIADFSQRELSRATGLSIPSVAHAEAGSRDLPVGALVRAAALAVLRLALVDRAGQEVGGMADAAVRDMGGRRFPAHLDTRHGDEGWWFDVHRYGRPRPWYTFDRDRHIRDVSRRRSGAPHDHQLPQPGDSPRERAAGRKAKTARRRTEERERRFLAGQLPDLPPPFACTCPEVCDELDDRSGRPVHAPECRCNCDIA